MNTEYIIINFHSIKVNTECAFCSNINKIIKEVIIISIVYTEQDYGVIQIDSPKFGVFKFLIDKEDIERCSKISWAILHSKLKEDWREYFYAKSCQNIPEYNKSMLLHRFVMNAPPDKMVDHIDLNTLNTRKSNLRLCDRNQNMRHSRGRSDNTSGIKGVTWDKSSDKWMAYIYMNTKFINLGYYDDINKAADIRKQAELKYFGEFQPAAG